ncbi:MAG: ribosome biogenesis GTPase Der [Pseudomonadota bacterium]|nr:ribosome biogenesis GTPase Der [Pseudomonadota bacterium]
MKPLIAIVGRPNVGKSTLFNRLVGRRSALVDPTPGVTRDRREGDARLGTLQFIVVDTAGLEDTQTSVLETEMHVQTLRAIEGSDITMLVFDARSGITPLDQLFAGLLRKLGSRVVLVGNKCEATASEAGLLDGYRLGFGEPVAVASEHGIGMGELEHAIRAELETIGRRPECNPGISDGEIGVVHEEIESALQLAIVGRPNVGKSTLVNSLIGDERMITGPESGITRDAILIEWTWRGQVLKLIDTAGMRRKSRLSEKIEKLSVSDALEAIRFAHVVVLVLDATMMPEKQDLVIARHIIDEGRAIVIAVNKWDLVLDRPDTLRKLYDRMEISLPQIRGVPVVTLSATTCHGIHNLLPEAMAIHDVWNKRVSTGPLNRWLHGMVERHPPPVHRGRRIRIRYITQLKARPPTFVVFASQPTGIPESYTRYLSNGIREMFNFPGVPIRINFRRQHNPFDPDVGDR